MMMITKVDDEVEDIVIKLSLGVAGNVVDQGLVGLVNHIQTMTPVMTMIIKVGAQSDVVVEKGTVHAGVMEVMKAIMKISKDMPNAEKREIPLCIVVVATRSIDEKKEVDVQKVQEHQNAAADVGDSTTVIVTVMTINTTENIRQNLGATILTVMTAMTIPPTAKETNDQ